jgi:hypothetical protein
MAAESVWSSALKVDGDIEIPHAGSRTPSTGRQVSKRDPILRNDRWLEAK